MHIVVQWVQSSGNTGKHNKPYVNCQWYGLPLMRESFQGSARIVKNSAGVEHTLPRDIIVWFAAMASFTCI